MIVVYIFLAKTRCSNMVLQPACKRGWIWWQSQHPRHCVVLQDLSRKRYVLHHALWAILPLRNAFCLTLHLRCFSFAFHKQSKQFNIWVFWHPYDQEEYGHSTHRVISFIFDIIRLCMFLPVSEEPRQPWPADQERGRPFAHSADVGSAIPKRAA